MRRGMRCLLAGAAALAAAAAPAQKLELEPTPALACLTVTDPKRIEPEYPFDAFKRARPGSVTVLLRFSAPDRAPEVVVEQGEDDPSFERAVREHATALRVPCLRAQDGTVSLRRTYRFMPDDRHLEVGAPTDPDTERRHELLRCANHPERTEGRQGTPDYPLNARRAEVQGRVLALLRFTRADAPPQITLHRRPSARVFDDAVELWARQYRLPCFEAGKDRPVELSVVFEYFMEGNSAFGFRPMSLPALVPHIRGIRAQTFQADTNTMQCPFDVHLFYRQPNMPNGVTSVGAHVAARAPLLAWLRTIELDVGSRALDGIYADTALITVPCVKIDLKPSP